MLSLSKMIITNTQNIKISAQFAPGAARQWPEEKTHNRLCIRSKLQSVWWCSTLRSLTCIRQLLDHLILVVGYVSRQAAGQEYPNELKSSQRTEALKQRHASSFDSYCLKLGCQITFFYYFECASTLMSANSIRWRGGKLHWLWALFRHKTFVLSNEEMCIFPVQRCGYMNIHDY